MAKVEKISKANFLKMIKEEANKIKEEILKESSKDAVEKVAEPMDVKMNQNDGLGDSNKALVYKDAKKKEEKAGEKATVEKMNSMDKEQGSDKKAAAAVEVKAGAEKGGNDVTTGQHKANFTSKTENPSKEVSDPFQEKAVDEMNTMDKLTDEKTKTYVDAGAAKGGHTVVAGQHKAEVKEKAPVVKDKAPIAKGIEIKESYTKTELQSFIMSEAKKLVKKQMLENELKKLNEELGTL